MPKSKTTKLTTEQLLQQLGESLESRLDRDRCKLIESFLVAVAASGGEAKPQPESKITPSDQHSVPADNLFTDQALGATSIRQWKSPATQSPTISSTPPKAESGPQTDLSSKLQQTPLPPVCYMWYRDPASGVWNISVPPKPEGFPVKDLVGLAYIQVALREHGKELPAFQIQAFAEARKVGATLSSAGPGLLDGNRDDEGIAHEGRLNDGLSGYETTQLVLDKTEMSKIKNELKDIETSLAKAELNHDQAQIVLFKTEKEKILEFLDHARGKGKRSRRMKSPHGLACDAVRNGIVRAIDKISKIDSDAGQFLKKYIKTGWIVSYTGPEVNWQFYK